MADVVYINAEEGIKRVMNNVKLYYKLLGKFRTEANLKNLENFIVAQDWENAQGAAHSIKGLAANLSLTELFNQSLDLETQIKGRALKPGVLENYKICFNETLIAVEKLITQNA